MELTSLQLPERNSQLYHRAEERVLIRVASISVLLLLNGPGKPNKIVELLSSGIGVGRADRKVVMKRSHIPMAPTHKITLAIPPT